MSRNLKGNIKVTRVLNAVAAGTTDQESSIIDIAGFCTVRFVAMFGTLTAGAVTGIKLQAGEDAGGGDMQDVAGSALAIADSDDNKILISERKGAMPRYVRCVVTRGVANAVIDGVICEQSDATKVPVDDDATVAGNELAIGAQIGTA